MKAKDERLKMEVELLKPEPYDRLECSKVCVVLA